MEKFMGVWKCNTTKKRKNNPHPCENCRRARKGCEGGYPCLRCKERNLSCEQSLDSYGSHLCTLCRRNHRKCNGDGVKPCTYCKKNNVECVYVGKNKEIVVSPKNERFSFMGEIIAQLQHYDKEIFPLMGINSIDFKKLDIQSVVDRQASCLNFFLYAIMATSSKQISGSDQSAQLAQVAEDIFRCIDKSNNILLADGCLLLGLYYFSIEDELGFHYAKLAFALMPDQPDLNKTIYGPMKGWTEINCQKLITTQNCQDPVVLSDFNRLPSWSEAIPIHNFEHLKPGDPRFAQLLISLGGELISILNDYESNPSNVAYHPDFYSTIVTKANQFKLMLDKCIDNQEILAKHMLMWIYTNYSLVNLFYDMSLSLWSVTEAMNLFKTLPRSSFTVFSLVACEQIGEAFLRTPYYQMIGEVADVFDTLVEVLPKAPKVAQKLRQRLYKVGDTLSKLYPVPSQKKTSILSERRKSSINNYNKPDTVPNNNNNNNNLSLNRKSLDIHIDAELPHINHYNPTPQVYTISVPQVYHFPQADFSNKKLKKQKIQHFEDVNEYYHPSPSINPTQPLNASLQSLNQMPDQDIYLGEWDWGNYELNDWDEALYR